MVNIFVGNLDYGVSEDEIRRLFESHGRVDRVTLVKDRETGQPRGFGFVEMSDSGEGQRAIAALNGTMVGSRAINVNEARPRGEGGGGGGFRRQGGGGAGGGGGFGNKRREPRW